MAFSVDICSLRNADLPQTSKQLVRTRSHSYRRKRLARRYLTKIRAIKCHVLHALSLTPIPRHHPRPILLHPRAGIDGKCSRRTVYRDTIAL